MAAQSTNAAAARIKPYRRGRRKIEITPQQVLRGTIGDSEAVFRLNWSGDEKTVSGTYSQGSKTYRIKGTGKPGHMSLDEYTGERLTAHIKLTLDDLETYWTGTMYNVYPDKNQYPVKLLRPQ
jgi:hypothetical protein